VIPLSRASTSSASGSSRRQHQLTAVDTRSTSGAAARPFHDAIRIEPLGIGRYAAELGPLWTVGTKAHGGLLLVLLAKAGLAGIDADAPGSAPDPLAVAANFLRAPDLGPVELETQVLKIGRTASVVSVRMTQGGRAMLAATVTAGRLPDDEPRWADLSDLAAEPPGDATAPDGPGLAGSCELKFDTPTFAFARGEQGPPVLRGWARPRGEPVDVLFALLAGDILPPAVFNLGGGFGWAPTVQLTALLRGRPAPGWLRVESRSCAVASPWFDEDVTVIDTAGRLVCQARQLALSPLAR
jgi:hypothetical protein